MVSCPSWVEALLHYNSQRYVQVTDWRLGALFRFLQFAVVGYVLGYGIIFQKGYQKYDAVVGTTTIKVKGCAYQNCSGKVTVFDAQDAVVPPLMKDAFFVTTRFQAQEQTRNLICSVASDNTTNSGRKCSKGCIEGDTTLYGIMTGTCGKYGYCEILTWCPLEKDPKIDYQNLLYGIRNFSVFIRTNVQFPLFDVTVTSGKSPVPGLSQFYLRDMLKDACDGECFENARMRGAVILAKAEYECDLDNGKSGCRPQWSFSRIDEGDGFNFRSIRYLNKNSTTREIRKLYGINVVVDIYGRAGQFDVVSLLTAIGAGLGLLTLATIVADFLLNTIWPRRELFLHDKFLTVNLEHEADIKDFPDTEKSAVPMDSKSEFGSGYKMLNDGKDRDSKSTASTVPNPLLLACPDDEESVDL